MYDLIIIGGGPAALSAARFAAGKQLHVVMVYEELGGKIGWLESLTGPARTKDMPGNELAHMLVTRITEPGGPAINDRVVAIEKPDTAFRVETANHGTLYGKAVLMATGASPLPLTVPGADSYLEKGLGYSITSHAHLVAGQRVAMIGATPRALSGVAEIATTADRIYIIAPHTQWLASPLGQALHATPSIEILGGYEVLEINGDDRLQSVTVALGATKRKIEVDRVFVALGVVPNSGLVRRLVETDDHGYILVNGYHETSLRGLYAAGDVSTLFSEQVIIAIGDGARAARTAYDYLLAERLVPEHVRGATVKRILVAHASELGSTAEIARVIGVELRTCGATVDVLPVVEVHELRAYQGAIIGSAVYNGRWLPEAVHFVEFHAAELSLMPVAYFVVSATIRDGSEQSRRNARTFIDPLLRLAPAVQPVDIGLFAGQIDVRKLPWIVRLRMRLVTKLRHGDYRDWAAIRAWTRQAAAHLGVRRQSL